MKFLKMLGTAWRRFREGILVAVATVLFPFDMLSQGYQTISDFDQERLRSWLK